MIGQYLSDILLALLFECVLRRAICDAVEYSRNKKAVREYYKNASSIRNILRLYKISSSHAPRHLALFYSLRILNISIVVGAISIFSFFPVQNCIIVYRRLIQVKFILLYLPFLIYVLFFLKNPKRGDKRLDFSRFRKP